MLVTDIENTYIEKSVRCVESNGLKSCAERPRFAFLEFITTITIMDSPPHPYQHRPIIISANAT